MPGWGWKSKSRSYQTTPLEAKKRQLLRVPVTRDPQSGCGREIVFRIMGTGVNVGMGVEGVAIVADLAVAGVKVAAGRLLDQIVPLPVERGDSPVAEAEEKRSHQLLRQQGKSEGVAR